MMLQIILALVYLIVASCSVNAQQAYNLNSSLSNFNATNGVFYN